MYGPAVCLATVPAVEASIVFVFLYSVFARVVPVLAAVICYHHVTELLAVQTGFWSVSHLIVPVMQVLVRHHAHAVLPSVFQFLSRHGIVHVLLFPVFDCCFDHPVIWLLPDHYPGFCRHPVLFPHETCPEFSFVSAVLLNRHGPVEDPCYVLLYLYRVFQCLVSCRYL